MLGIRTPNRVVVAWSAGEAKKVASLKIQDPQTGIARKLRHSQALAVRGESQGEVKPRNSMQRLRVPRRIERVDTRLSSVAGEINQGPMPRRRCGEIKLRAAAYCA